MIIFKAASRAIELTEEISVLLAAGHLPAADACHRIGLRANEIAALYRIVVSEDGGLETPNIAAAINSIAAVAFTASANASVNANAVRSSVTALATWFERLMFREMRKEYPHRAA